jgi:hypothetical protein
MGSIRLFALCLCVLGSTLATADVQRPVVTLDLTGTKVSVLTHRTVNGMEVDAWRIPVRTRMWSLDRMAFKPYLTTLYVTLSKGDALVGTLAFQRIRLAKERVTTDLNPLLL